MIICTKLHEIQEGKMETIEIGGKDLIITNIEGKLKCFSRWCPHKGGDLAYGDLIGDNQIRCHLHGYVYDLNTGRPSKIPYVSDYGKWKETSNLEIYDIIVIEGEICVEVK